MGGTLPAFGGRNESQSGVLLTLTGLNLTGYVHNCTMLCLQPPPSASCHIKILSTILWQKCLCYRDSCLLQDSAARLRC